MPPAFGRSKYRNTRTEYDGQWYDSKAEASRAAVLDLQVRAGVIAYWIRQPKLCLGCPENVYRPDFHVIATNGDTWMEDVKGVETAKFKRDRKLWAAYGPCPLHIVKGKRVEVVQGGRDPRRKEEKAC